MLLCIMLVIYPRFIRWNIQGKDNLGIQKSADKTNLNEVTLDEYETIYWNYDVLPGQ